MLTTRQDWQHLFEGAAVEDLEQTLPAILRTRRWFGGKARDIAGVQIIDSIPIPSDSTARVLLIRVAYADGGVETYNLPLATAFGKEADRIRRECPHAVIAPLVLRKPHSGGSGLLYDALWNRGLGLTLLGAIDQNWTLPGVDGSIQATRTQAFADCVPSQTDLEPVVMGADQSNTSIAYGGRAILKFYRRMGEGTNPDVEIGRALTRNQFPYVPAVAGELEYRNRQGIPGTLGVLQKFVPNHGDGWQQSLEVFDQFIERIRNEHLWDERPSAAPSHRLDLAQAEYSAAARRLIGPYLESAARLGNRTAELHLALSRIADDPAFAPELLTPEYRRSRHESMVKGVAETFSLVKERVALLPTRVRAMANMLVELKPELHRIFDAFRNVESPVPLIRCHGDYHLGQVLCTGNDFIIIDFEGEPAQPLAERRMKHPPVMDVAGMIRSFHYVPFAFLNSKGMEQCPWTSFWSGWASAAFLKGYLELAMGKLFWPQDPEVVQLLFDVYVMNKALYELRYELNNRPDWVEIPLRGLVELLRPATLGERAS
jgi:trehalose synthase-fused probable maltokinase